MACSVVPRESSVYSRKPEYRLELVSVTSAEVASVVAKEFGEILQNAGVEIVIVDNDKKAHSKTVTDAWATTC